MAYFDNLDPCWIPDAPFGEKPKWRQRVAQFGDGYSQRILDGINALDQSFTVSFYRSSSQLIPIDTYLKSLGGQAFPFTHPVTGTTYIVWCDEWDVAWDIKRRRDPITFQYSWYGNLTAEFKKANGVDITPIS